MISRKDAKAQSFFKMKSTAPLQETVPITLLNKLLIVDDHPHFPASPSCSHRIELFIKGIGKADHKIATQIVRCCLLQIVSRGGLVDTYTLVEQIVDSDF
jgi:hypothetical protein